MAKPVSECTLPVFRGHLFRDLCVGSRILLGKVQPEPCFRGTLRGATTGGITSLAFLGVAAAYEPASSLDLRSGASMAEYSRVALASGVTGGVLAQMQGGRFGHGFASAGVSVYLAPIPEHMTSQPGAQAVIAAVLGGTVSEVTGGSFANGAMTSAFQFAFGRSANCALAPDGGGGVEKRLWTSEAQAEFESLSISLTTDLKNSPPKTSRAAAERFGEIFVPFTAKHGVEVGGNIVPTSKGFGVEDLRLGSWRGVSVAQNAFSDVFVHTHPLWSGAGLSSGAIYSNGRFKLYEGDVQYAFERTQSAYAYRVGVAVAYFYYIGFSRALSAARASGSYLHSNSFISQVG